MHPVQDGKLSQSFRLHAVTFQVASSSPFVPQTFLPLLLAQFRQVDKTSALLPQPEAAEHVKRLCYSKDFQPLYRPFLEWESRSFHPRMASLCASFGCLLTPNSHHTNQIANSKHGQNIQPSKSLFRLRSAQKAKNTLGCCSTRSHVQT